MQTRNQADHLIHATRKTLEEAGDKATDEEREAINTAITDLEAVLKSNDKDEIEAKTKALTDASGALAQKMYAEAQKTQGDNSATDAGQQQNAGDDVVDAEFEEVDDDKKK